MQAINTSVLRNHLEYLASKPHLAGSLANYETAKYVHEKFQQAGLESQLQSFEAPVNYPFFRYLEVVYPPSASYVARLTEEVVDEDPSSINNTAIPTFSGYSGSGNVTGEVVYVNYGKLEDFEELTRRGINLAGKIALIRYGKIFRGVKVMLAELHGAAGVILYSDPIDDGFARGEVYPKGPWRPPTGVQRGTVQYLNICPGDYRRTDKCLGAENKLELEDFIPSIPVLPISHADALPIISNLGGEEGPVTWNGALQRTYNIGPGPAVVNLVVEMNTTLATLWNVVGTIKGLETEEDMVILGAQRDAWVYGAVDPSSGTAALLEVARAFGTLLQNSWKPRRSVVLCSWDGGQYGLLGSTWFAEGWSNLSTNAVVYLNGDAIASGPNFGVSATPSLVPLIRRVASQIPYPTMVGQNLLENWNGVVGNLGTGSDYTAFIHHLGIPSVDFSFRSDSYSGVFHSIYDSFHWMTKFGDPYFQYHRMAAQFWGLLALEITNSQVLPFNFTHYGYTLRAHISDLSTFSRNTVKRIKRETAQLSQELDLTQLAKSIESFVLAAVDLEKQRQKMNLYDTREIDDYNTKVLLIERQFLLLNGLIEQGRPWYRHSIHAPALWEGAGGEIFPAILEPLKNNDLPTAQFQLQRTAEAIYNASLRLQASRSNFVIVVIAIVCVLILGVGIGVGIYMFWRKRAADNYQSF